MSAAGGSDPVRVGLVGAGDVAARHVAAAAEGGWARVVAVADRHPDRAARLAARAGATPYADPARLLDDPAVELVVLAVPHAHHAELAVRAATGGRHVLVEKPMATTVPDCDAMVDAARRAGVLLWVGHQQRQFSQVRAARDLLHGGELGAPLLYAERRSHDYGWAEAPAWFTDAGLAGGGIAMLVGPHTVDRASWLLGGPPVAVAGSTATPPGWRVETDAAGTLWCADAPPAHFALLNDREFYHETTVVCERGRLRITSSGLTVTGPDGGRRWVLEVDPDREYTLSFARQYEALARTLRDGAPPAVTPEEGRAVVAAVCGLYASAGTGGGRVELG
ncbi:MAG TPA: Gfo/Idh/MocA family oxidoreductase [Pilimelia sp.]|nr:Gfo/Idh/MocA family oxidoreductase [Pilimelia sp.]